MGVIRLISLLTIPLFVCSAEKAPVAKDSKSGDVEISITLGDLVAARPALTILFGFPMPVKTAWTLRKTVSAIDAELKNCEDQRVALVKKHGKEKDGQTSVPLENAEAFSAEYAQLMAIEVKIRIVPVSLEMLTDAKLSTADILKLERFLTQ